MLEGSKCPVKILSMENLGLTIVGWAYPQLTEIFIKSTMIILRIDTFFAALAVLEFMHR
jgi:hypothetical protein